MRRLDVGQEFYPRLANRDNYQGDGKHTAAEFRNKFLSDLDDPGAWKESTCFIILDFKNVKKIGPSFANEAFAYFTKYTSPDRILQRIQFENISEVHLSIIREELRAGYSRL